MVKFLLATPGVTTDSMDLRESSIRQHETYCIALPMDRVLDVNATIDEIQYAAGHNILVKPIWHDTDPEKHNSSS